MLPKGRSSTTNSGTKVASRCGSFPLLSALQIVGILKITPHSYPWLRTRYWQNNVSSFSQEVYTERGGSVVTHETRIREVPGSNTGADQPDRVFSCFSSVIKANAGLDFHYHDPFHH